MSRAYLFWKLKAVAIGMPCSAAAVLIILHVLGNVPSSIAMWIGIISGFCGNLLTEWLLRKNKPSYYDESAS